MTWIDLAVSLSLHKDACIAVWLDIGIGEPSPVSDLRIFLFTCPLRPKGFPNARCHAYVSTRPIL